MSDIGPGDWVECVDDSLPDGDWDDSPTPFMLGALYQIERLQVLPSGRPGCCVIGIEGCYRLARFRPIRDGQERITRKVTDKVPA